jgi:hypothetical protein
MVSGFSNGGELNDKHANGANQEYVHHAAFVKKKSQDNPN